MDCLLNVYVSCFVYFEHYYYFDSYLSHVAIVPLAIAIGVGLGVPLLLVFILFVLLLLLLLGYFLYAKTKSYPKYGGVEAEPKKPLSEESIVMG